jgi:MFS family permease
VETQGVQNDPLWTLRYALAGVGLALLLSVPIAAVVGGLLGDWLGDSYEWRAGSYGALLLYVVAGAFVLFAKVARHETRPLGARRVALWLASLWLWPALLLWRQPAKTSPP